MFYNNAKYVFFCIVFCSGIECTYIGPVPLLFVTDLDMIKDITIKEFDKFVDRMVRFVLLS